MCYSIPEFGYSFLRAIPIIKTTYKDHEFHFRAQKQQIYITILVISIFFSYCFEDERGVFPEVEFVYDLKLPDEFQPCVGDGEVEEFYCWPIEKVTKQRLLIMGIFVSVFSYIIYSINLVIVFLVIVFGNRVINLLSFVMQ